MHTKYTRLVTRSRRPSRLRIKHVRQAARHPFAVPFITFASLFVVTGILLLVFNSRSTPVNPNVVVISHDGTQQIVSSKEPTVGALLAKLQLTINDGDVVEPALTTTIKQDDFRINLYRAVPVEIVDGGQKQFAFSAATTPRSVARQAGVTVYPEDIVETKPITDFVGSGGIGQEVIVNRATPISINLYGAALVMRTHAKTVRQLLTDKKVNLLPQDIVNVPLETLITPNAQLAVTRNGLSTITVQEDIPAPIQVIPDNTLSYGVSAVRQQGASGKRAVTYEINTQNGVEVGRKVIQTIIVQPPVTQISVQGANLSGSKGDMALAGIAPGDYTYADYIISKESGWCPTKWQGEYGGCPVYHGAPTSSYTGYGLCQATPGYKMASAGEDWATNPVTQLRWCSGYAQSRHGGWAGAYNYWLAHHNW